MSARTSSKWIERGRVPHASWRASFIARRTGGVVMRLVALIMCWLALGCSSTVYLGDNRGDVVDGATSPDLVIVVDARPESDAPRDHDTPLDARDEAITDASDVTDATDVSDVSDVTDVSDATDVEPSACERYSRARVIVVGESNAVFDMEPAHLPDTSCSTARDGAYVLTRFTLRERALVRAGQDGAITIALRRACDDPATEIFCGRRFTAQVLDAGTYYLLVETDPTSSSRAVSIGAWPVGTSLEGNVRCESARDLTAPAQLSESLDRATAPRAGCLPFETGPARYYRATVPPGQRLLVSVQQSGSSAPDVPRGSMLSPLFSVSVRLFASCAATTCLAAVSAGPGFPANAGWTNTGAAPAEIFIAVAAPLGDVASSVTVTSQLTTPAPGERCDAPDVLTPGTSLVVDLTTATERPAPCGDEHFPLTAARFVRVRVPARHTLDAFAIPRVYGPVRPWLRLYERCGDTACLGDRWSWQSWFYSSTLYWSNDTDVDRDLILAVGAQVGTAGEAPTPVTVDAAVRPIGAGQRCESPIDVPVDGSTTVLSTEGSTVLLPRCSTREQSSFTRFFRVTIPPRQGVRLDTQLSAGGPPNYTLYQLDGCSLSCATISKPDLTNPTDAPRTVLLALAADQLGSTYRLRIAATPLPLLPQASCERATPVALGVSRVPLSLFTVGAMPCDLLYSSSYFRVTVPPRSVLEARPLPRVAIAFLDRCGGACLPGSPLSTFNDRAYQEPGAWAVNDTDAPREEILAYANNYSSTPRDEAVLLEASPIARNSTCASATLVTPGVDLLHEDAAGGVETPGRNPRGTAASVFYRARVPAGRRITFDLRRPADARGPWFVMPTLLTSCDTPISGGLMTRISWVNRSAAEQDAYLAVAASAGHDSRFELSAQLSEPAPTVACDAATTLTDGSVLRDVELPEAFTSYPTWSDALAFVQATVPPGQTLAVTSSVPVQELIAYDCGGTIWERQTNRRTITRTNTTSASQRMLIGLASTTAAPVRATIRAAIAPSMYNAESIGGGCDTLTGAPVIAGDEATTAVQALPFTMRYFGEAQRGFSVSSNGYLQLWPDAAGAAPRSARPSSSTLPLGDAPSNVVAPHWDDLTTSGADAGVRFATFDSPRRHLTVEWRDVFHWQSDATVARTFQAWLYEDGVIEFRYCRHSMVGVGYTTVFGLQNASATRWTAWERPLTPATDPLIYDRGTRFTPL